MPLSVSYYSKGTVLVNELYGISPFQVEYILRDSSVEDVPIYVTFKNRQTCRISYSHGMSQVSQEMPIGVLTDFPELSLKVHISNYTNIASQKSRVSG